MVQQSNRDELVRDLSQEEIQASPELTKIQDLVEKVSMEGANAETLVDAEPEGVARILAQLSPPRKHQAKPFKVGVRRFEGHKAPRLDDFDRSQSIETEDTRFLYDALGLSDDGVLREGGE